MQNILVIGGEGYIGSNLLRRLSDENHNLYSLDSVKNEDNRIEGVHYITGNSRNIKYLDFAKFHTIFHFGEYSRIRSSFDDVDVIMKDNFLGTYEVIKYCHENNCRLIYSASSSGFGGNENLSPYSWQKSKSVELIKNYSQWFGLDYSIAYFYNVYGNNHIQTGKMATVIGIFEHHYLNNLPMPLIGTGEQMRDFTHINDIVEGLYNIYIKSEDENEFHLGTGESHRIIDVAKMFSNNIQYTMEFKGERRESIMPQKQPKWWKTTIKLNEYITKFKQKN